ncbi:hypothetical protein V865_002187 [Kwoniella europaea PYCC6329]|uniref:BD-FAE-like domain-containing protein n=1 Tax=Kwoniella europaea PYCC6329 TaxID=1423913 RepID=A0AAX4KC55_9TREE
MTSNGSTPLTFTYDPINKIDLDVYLPTNDTIQGDRVDVDIKSLPALIFFHGGGLTSGSKKDLYFPKYLMEQCLSKNIIFIAANYRLLLPLSGIDILQDVETLFSYLSSSSTELVSSLQTKGFQLNHERLGVVGVSGGDYLARASIVLPPSKIPEKVRPKVYVDLYGMGGDWLLDHWIKAKPSMPNLIGTPYDPTKVERILADVQQGKEGVKSESPIQVGGDDQGRLGFLNHWYKTGEYVDDLLAEPGLSRKLELLPYEERFEAIPQDKKWLLLPLEEDRLYPKTMIIHGEKDNLVPVDISKKLQKDLESLGENVLEIQAIYPTEAGHGLLDVGRFPNIVPIPEITEILNRCVEFVSDALRE